MLSGFELYPRWVPRRMTPVEGLSFPVRQTSNSLSLLEISVNHKLCAHENGSSINQEIRSRRVFDAVKGRCVDQAVTGVFDPKFNFQRKERFHQIFIVTTELTRSCLTIDSHFKKPRHLV